MGGGGGGGNAKLRKSLPYWDEECTAAIKDRNAARSKANRSRLLIDCIEYRRLKGVTQAVLKKKSRDSWQEYCSTLQDSSKLGAVWGMARKMSGKNGKTTIPSLESNGVWANSSQEKANMLADCYEKISSDENYSPTFTQHRAKCESDPEFAAPPVTSDEGEMNKDFTIHELEAALKSCKKGSSPGPDLIHYEMLQQMPECMKEKLLQLYNLVWATGKIPTQWKHAEIVPITKPEKKKSEPSSYRPISLTSALCKLMERMTNDRLTWHLETNKLFNPAQTGFRRNLSTQDQIMKLQDAIIKQRKSKGAVLGVFLDMEKAYDMLWVNGLLHKLKKLKIGGRMFSFIQDFITQRTFHVKVGDKASTKRTLQNGTPQGSVISPTLFLVMINDMATENKDVDLSLFADDSATFTGGGTSSAYE